MQESLLSSFKTNSTIVSAIAVPPRSPGPPYLTRKVDYLLRLGRTAVLRAITLFGTFGTIIAQGSVEHHYQLQSIEDDRPGCCHYHSYDSADEQSGGRLCDQGI